jgi:hypothetical protein
MGVEIDRLLAVETAALVISIVALLAAGWSAWGTHRQARATEDQARAASEANATAQEALDLAREADARERTRQHLEERPNFEVSGKRVKGKLSLTTVTIRNNGPLEYDSVTVTPDLTDPETKRLVRGVQHEDELSVEVNLGALKPGESLVTALVRTNPQLGGQAKLAITATRHGREWQMFHYVPVSRPPRAISL